MPPRPFERFSVEDDHMVFSSLNRFSFAAGFCLNESDSAGTDCDMVEVEVLAVLVCGYVVKDAPTLAFEWLEKVRDNSLTVQAEFQFRNIQYPVDE